MTRKNLKKTSAIIALITMAAVMAVGCGKKHNSSTNYYSENYDYAKTAGEVAYDAGGYGDYEYDYGDYEMDYAMEEAEYAAPQAALAPGSNGVVDSGSTGIIDQGSAQKRKLIRTVELEVETKEYDALKQSIEDQINALGGYIENEFSYNGSSYRNDGYQEKRHSTMTIRIPDNKLDEFVTVMSGMSNVVSKSTSATDVTLQYTDIESKRDMYLAEQESLLALLEKAESIEDITYLTQRLTDVRYNIESMERQLRLYDNQVDYATVYLNVSEVEILTPQVVQPKTPGEIIKEGFEASKADVLNSIRDFGMNFVINLPYIIRFLVISAIVVGINYAIVRIIIACVKKSVLKKRAKKAAKEQAAKEAAENADAKKEAAGETAEAKKETPEA